MRARGHRLYAKSRRLTTAAVLIAFCSGVGLAIGGAQLRLSEDSSAAVPWVVLLPLIGSVITAMSLESPMPVAERLAARRLSPLLLLHLAALVALTIAGGFINTAGIHGAYGWASASRNAAAFTGIALLGGLLTGYRLAWIGPMTWAFACLSFGVVNGRPRAWALPLAPDGNAGPAVAALILFAIGALLACWPLTPMMRPRARL